jgi:predicted PurR-regulated permease PerM
MTLATAVLLVAPLALLVATLADSVAGLVATLGKWFEVGPPGPPAWLANIPLIGGRLTQRWAEIAADGPSFTAALMLYMGTIRTWVLNAGASLGGGIAMLLVSLILAAFIYGRGNALAARLDAALGRIGGARAQHLAAVAGNTVRGVVYGVLGANLIQAIIQLIAFLIVGVPGAVLLAVLSFFLTLVPGAPTLLWLPTAIWLFTQGDTAWAIFLVVWSILNYGPMESLLRIVLIGRSSPLPLLILLLGILGGIVVFGLLGLLIGPAVLAVGFTLLSEWSAVPGQTSEPSVARTADAPAE